MRRGALGLWCLLVAGCGGYYNGMYNLKRLATQARKAEREGRRFDSQGLWGQVSTRAESLLARHPRKGWTDEARLLQGTALVKLGNCSRALGSLEIVMVAARNDDVAEQAAELAAGCRLEQGDPLAAASAFGRLARSRIPTRRSLAHVESGRALRLAGQDEAALAELVQSADPRAAGERAVVLAGLGRLPEAVAVAESLITGGDTLAPWDVLVERVQRHDPGLAASLVDRLGVEGRLPPGLRARILAQDAEQWERRDSARAAVRWEEAEQAARGTSEQGPTSLRRARARLVTLDSVAALWRLVGTLEEVSEGSGPLAQLVETARRVATTADSTPSGSPRGDLRLFVAGELARDSLGTPRFAAAQFRRMATEWPDSPYAPKALLALVLLDSLAADSLRDELRLRYAESPYVRLAMGEDATAPYQVIEDSLRRFIAALRVPARRGAPGVGPRPQPVPKPSQPQPQAPQAPQPATPPRAPVEPF